jgi:vancomycin permeability regulator SanA
MPAVGVAADRRVYSSPDRHWWQLRELVALVRAYLDVHIFHPHPVLGDKLPIEITDRQPEVSGRNS